MSSTPQSIHYLPRYLPDKELFNGNLECLPVTKTFKIFQLQRRHGVGRGNSRHADAIEELKNAFDLAERSSPGITGRLLEQIIVKLQPGMSEARLQQAVENLLKR